jgi:hypothetical protein
MTRAKPLFRYAAGTLFAALFFVLGAAMLADLIDIDRPLPALDTAISAEATVTGNRVMAGHQSMGKFPRPSRNRYFITVAFVAGDNQLQANEISVGQTTFNSHLPGQKVTVWYFPGRPQASVLDEPRQLAEAGSHWGKLLGLVFLCGGGWAALMLGNRLIIAHRGYGLL